MRWRPCLARTAPRNAHSRAHAWRQSGLVSHLSSKPCSTAPMTRASTRGRPAAAEAWAACPDPRHQGHAIVRTSTLRSAKCRRGERGSQIPVGRRLRQRMSPTPPNSAGHAGEHFPADGGRHNFARAVAIYLNRPARAPGRHAGLAGGAFPRFLITRSDQATCPVGLLQPSLRRRVVYRPTIHYATTRATTPCFGARIRRQPTVHLRITHSSFCTRSPPGRRLGVLLAVPRRTRIGMARSCPIRSAEIGAVQQRPPSLQVSRTRCQG